MQGERSSSWHCSVLVRLKQLAAGMSRFLTLVGSRQSLVFLFLIEIEVFATLTCHDDEMMTVETIQSATNLYRILYTDLWFVEVSCPLWSGFASKLWTLPKPTRRTFLGSPNRSRVTRLLMPSVPFCSLGRRTWTLLPWRQEICTSKRLSSLCSGCWAVKICEDTWSRLYRWLY